MRQSASCQSPAGSGHRSSANTIILTFRPSNDDEIHLTMRGTYIGTEPRLQAVTSGGVTTTNGSVSVLPN